jgi:hypothetical protein
MMGWLTLNFALGWGKSNKYYPPPCWGVLRRELSRTIQVGVIIICPPLIPTLSHQGRWGNRLFSKQSFMTSVSPLPIGREAQTMKIPLYPPEGMKKFGESVGQGYLQSFTNAII